MRQQPFAPMSRKAYRWTSLSLLALQLVAIALLPYLPWLGEHARAFYTSIFVVLGFITGARLADAGYPRWIGIVGVLGLTVAPLVAYILMSMFAVGQHSVDFLQHAGLAALIIVWPEHVS